MCIRDRDEGGAFGKAPKDVPSLTCDAKFRGKHEKRQVSACLLYTSDAADERSSVDLGGRRIIKKKNTVVTERRTRDMNKNPSKESDAT